MTLDRRTKTWFELNIPSPLRGVVFVHTEKKDRPLMITKVSDDEIIYRVDADGDVSVWGDVYSWRDEARRRIIEVVYDPRDKDAENR